MTEASAMPKLFKECPSVSIALIAITCALEIRLAFKVRTIHVVKAMPANGIHDLSGHNGVPISISTGLFIIYFAWPVIFISFISFERVPDYTCATVNSERHTEAPCQRHEIA